MKTLLLIISINIFSNEEIQISQIKENILKSNKRDTVMLQNMTVKDFKNKLYELESRGYHHSKVNKYGFLGKYQVSDYYLETFGRTSKEEFLNSVWEQEILMNRLCVYYIRCLENRDFHTYIGMNINGITVTLEGLMAGWHQHPLALKLWLESCGEIDLTDGFNTPVSKFIQYYEI